MIRDHLENGKKVFSVIHGFGKVEMLKYNSVKFAIGVVFEKSKEFILYTKDGRRDKNDLYRELYTIEETEYHKLTKV